MKRDVTKDQTSLRSARPFVESTFLCLDTLLIEEFTKNKLFLEETMKSSNVSKLWPA